VLGTQSREKIKNKIILWIIDVGDVRLFDEEVVEIDIFYF
jgi:hypothetical protein